VKLTKDKVCSFWSDLQILRSLSAELVSVFYEMIDSYAARNSNRKHCERSVSLSTPRTGIRSNIITSCWNNDDRGCSEMALLPPGSKTYWQNWNDAEYMTWKVR